MLTLCLHFRLFLFWTILTRGYTVGLTIGFFSVPAINSLFAHLLPDYGLLAVFGRDACSDKIARAGWIFSFYERRRFDYRFRFDLPVLLMDPKIDGILNLPQK